MSPELIGELAQHPNIIGIKDSSGSVDRIRDTVAATQNSARRTVEVTQVFEATTARMLMASQNDASATFVSAGDLASGVAAVATAPPAPPIKTRNREVGFQVLTGSERSILASLEPVPRVLSSHSPPLHPRRPRRFISPGKTHDLKLAEEKQQRIHAAGARILGAFGLAGIKYACDFNGYYGGHPRSPILPLSAEQKAEVEGLLAEIRN